MKVAKFYVKYFLTRSTGKVENIERVIKSHGFKIFEFDPLDPEAPSSKFLQYCNCWDCAQLYPCFTFTKKDEKYVFIREGLSHDDQLVLLFHEEAHIWYNHPNITGYTDDTDTQQEVVANKFLPRLRLLKTVTTLILLSALAVGVYFFLTPSAQTEDHTPSIELQTQNQPSGEPEVPADVSSEQAWITESGDCYHRQDCYQIQGSNTLSIPKNLAEQFGKTPCRTCLPE